MLIYQDVEPIATDHRREAYRGHVKPLSRRRPYHVYARWLYLGKRHVLRLYAKSSNGTFPVTVVVR